MTKRYYIDMSSIFNAYPYNYKQFRKVLGRVIRNPRLSYNMGLSNQPKVLTFDLPYYNEESEKSILDYISFQLKMFVGNRKVIIREKNW